MNSRHGWFALALCGCALLVMADSAEAATTNVNIVYNPSSTPPCYQTSTGFSGALVPVTSGNTITYTAQQGSTTGVPFELQFAGTGPFVDIYTDHNGTTPPARGPAGVIHGYQVVIVNGNKCPNARELGIIMR